MKRYLSILIFASFFFVVPDVFAYATVDIDSQNPVTITTTFSDITTDFLWQAWNESDLTNATHYCFVVETVANEVFWSPATPIANTSFSWSFTGTVDDVIPFNGIQLLAVNDTGVCGDTANWQGDGVGIMMNSETEMLGMVGPWTITEAATPPVATTTASESSSAVAFRYTLVWLLSFAGSWFIATKFL